MRSSQRGRVTRATGGLEPGPVAADLPALEHPGQLGQRPGGLGQGLVQPGGLHGVQRRGMGEHHPALRAERLDAGSRGWSGRQCARASTMVRRRAGTASSLGWSEGDSDPTKCGFGSARWAKLAATFCPASKTTVSSVSAAASPR